MDLKHIDNMHFMKEPGTGNKYI